jgi:hypothetical protein
LIQKFVKESPRIELDQ